MISRLCNDRSLRISKRRFYEAHKKIVGEHLRIKEKKEVHAFFFGELRTTVDGTGFGVPKTVTNSARPLLIIIVLTFG